MLFRSDASKVALVHLVARLVRGGYRLLDTQFVNDHLKRFGAVEVPRGDYLQMLAEALEHEVDHVNGILYVDRLDSPADLIKLDSTDWATARPVQHGEEASDG